MVHLQIVAKDGDEGGRHDESERERGDGAQRERETLSRSRRVDVISEKVSNEVVQRPSRCRPNEP